MNFRSLLPILIVLLSALSYAPIAAQAELKEKVRKEQERKQELQRKTELLLDEVATGASSLKLPENRSMVLGEAANLMWDHDRKRSRNIFWDAFNTITIVTSPKPDQDDKNQRRNAFLSTFMLRRELLMKVARRDSQLALDMLRSAQQPPADLFGPRYFLPDLEQEIATESASRDSQRALQIARESLAKRVGPELLTLLSRLHQLDTELSAKFAGEIIDKLQTRSLSSDSTASLIASELLIFSRTSDKSLAPGRIKLSREQRRQLVDMIANAVLGLSGNASLLNDVPDIMPEIEEFAPERAALIQKKAAAFSETLNKEQRGWRQYNSLVRNGTPEEMLAAAETAETDQRRMLQQQAVVLAVFSNQADSLRDYIENELKDSSARAELIETLDAEEIGFATNKGDVEALRKLLSRASLKEERARAMAELAVLLEKSGDHEQAVKLLDEAQLLIKSDFSSDTQTNALLALVAAYALVEPAKAFAIIEGAIDRANDQISRLLLLDKIAKTGVVKSGEIVLSRSGILSDASSRYGNAMAALANADFERSKRVADRLARNELRILARLTLAQALLAQNQRATNGENR